MRVFARIKKRTWVGVIGAGIVLIPVFGMSVIGVEALVRARLDDELLAAPTRYYARRIVLTAGRSLDAERLESQLKRLGYRNVEVNVEGTENILKLALKHGFKVIYASSLSVYGNPKRNPVSEDHEKNPITPYGITKLKAENLLENYAKLGVETIGLRYFNVYGKGKIGPNKGVIPDFLENIAKNEPLVIYGSGSQIRDFIFVGDVIKATCLAMESKMKSGFINIGSGIGTSISDLADLMISLSRKDLTTVSTPSQHDEFDIWADISKAQNSLGWTPETTLKKDLQKILL